MESRPLEKLVGHSQNLIFLSLGFLICNTEITRLTFQSCRLRWKSLCQCLKHLALGMPSQCLPSWQGSSYNLWASRLRTAELRDCGKWFNILMLLMTKLRIREGWVKLSGVTQWVHSRVKIQTQISWPQSQSSSTMLLGISIIVQWRLRLVDWNVCWLACVLSA